MTTREDFIRIARSYIGTPYHPGARIKGAGVDCATLVACCLTEAQLADVEQLGFYGQDWFWHTRVEHYMARLMRHAAKTLEGIALPSLTAQPGDIVLGKVAGSRVYNHAGIVTAWPRVIHAVAPTVVEVDASRDPLWANREVAVFDPFAAREQPNLLEERTAGRTDA